MPTPMDQAAVQPVIRSAFLSWWTTLESRSRWRIQHAQETGLTAQYLADAKIILMPVSLYIIKFYTHLVICRTMNFSLGVYGW